MLYANTVIPALRSALEILMRSDVFSKFRLVGGTALSLQLGHRMSDDIDLFTDVTYGSIDFDRINLFLHEVFSYVDHNDIALAALGKSYVIGNDKHNLVKLDVFYTDEFITEPFEFDGVRMARLDDIVAMKIEVVQNGGRKKDFGICMNC